MIDALLNVAPREAQCGFYRSSNGAEIDLLIDAPGLGLMAIEVKKGPNAKPRRGFSVSAKTYNRPTNGWCTVVPTARPSSWAMA